MRHIWRSEGASRERVKFVIDSIEHQAYGSTKEKSTFALRNCCLLLLCATLVISATLAHLGLFLILLGQTRLHIEKQFPRLLRTVLKVTTERLKLHHPGQVTHFVSSYFI